MDRQTFLRHLVAASEAIIPFSRQYLIDTLPKESRYFVVPNCSYDGNPRRGDEVVYPEDWDGCPEAGWGPWDAEQVVAYLWRDGKVPEWVDVTVTAADDTFTYLTLTCCGRFTAQEELLYYRPGGPFATGHHPFVGMGPSVPPRWTSLEESGKFALGWEARLRAHE
jgi:hypothetical protein